MLSCLIILVVTVLHFWLLYSLPLAEAISSSQGTQGILPRRLSWQSLEHVFLLLGSFRQWIRVGTSFSVIRSCFLGACFMYVLQKKVTCPVLPTVKFFHTTCSLSNFFFLKSVVFCCMQPWFVLCVFACVLYESYWLVL